MIPHDLESENRLLRRIIELISSRRTLHEVANEVAGLVTDATGSDVCFVHVVDRDAGRLVLAGATPPFDRLAGQVELSIGEGIAGWVAQHGTPVVVPDKWHDPRYRYIPTLRGEDYASLVSAPMLVDGDRVVGVVNAHARKEDSYGHSELALLTQVANLLAQTVENTRLYQRLTEREADLERFAARTVESQELERRRLAGEIHDGISQPLISLWYRLLTAEDGLGRHDEATVGRELGVAKELTTIALDETRRAIGGLRPSVLDDLGLGPSLESLVGSLPDLRAEIHITPCTFAPHLEVALYRIAQEALQNVVKHADASLVILRLDTASDSVRLVIADNGCGFDPSQPGSGSPTRPSYGMAGMRERTELIGGHLAVTTRAGGGTTVEVTVPLSGARDGQVDAISPT